MVTSLLSRMTQSAWTISEAKAKLSEILKLSNTEPQRIGTQKRYVVVPEAVWDNLAPKRPLSGNWLLQNLAPSQAVKAEVGDDNPDYGLELPDRSEQDRATDNSDLS